MGRARRSDAAWPILETARRSCVPAPCPERTTREMCLRSYLLHGRLLLKRRLRRGRGRESPVVNHFQALDVHALEDDRGVDLLAGGDLRAAGSASLRAERSHCGSVRRDRRRSAIGREGAKTGRGCRPAKKGTRDRGKGGIPAIGQPVDAPCCRVSALLAGSSRAIAAAFPAAAAGTVPAEELLRPPAEGQDAGELVEVVTVR